MEDTGIGGIPAFARVEPVDRDVHRRPGVPMIPDRVAEWPPVAGRPIVPQETHQRILTGVEARLNFKGERTPVFGTSVPPRGLSGLIRETAYTLPEHKASRWLLLMVGDRVDVWEGRIARNPIPAMAVATGLLFAARRLARGR
jgi:hypothetical protein